MLQQFSNLVGNRVTIAVVCGGLALGAWHEFMSGVATVPNTNAAFSDAKIKDAQAGVATVESKARSCKERLDAFAKGMLIPPDVLKSMSNSSMSSDKFIQRMTETNPMDEQLARDCSPGYAAHADACSASFHKLAATFTPNMLWDDVKAKLEAHKGTGCGFSKADADFIEADLNAKSAACVNQSKAFYSSMPNVRANASASMEKVGAYMAEHKKTCSMNPTEANLFRDWAINSAGVDAATFDKAAKEATAKQAAK
ncbi:MULTISPECIES: hypothetical protein [unclassified Methylobacterium]|uniref:hypothetical protein n=1 Tax=unclassified Methylobacterium TaxID=2615210 RepID=UPI00226A9C50|nr:MULTISPECIES: hypothetical protein [unclassified Methylobacterium]